VLVVVAVEDGQESVVGDDLRRRGAEAILRQETGPGRGVLHARFPEEQPVDALVTELRAAGWPATTRPSRGGHLTAWLANTAPTVVSDRLCVCFPWSEFDRSAVAEIVEIDPGRSFGTGSPPSTRLLLTELAARSRGGEAVLDVGCGSGVLALSAARLGATSVAMDIEPDGREATRANARRNRLAGQVCVDERALDGSETFDVVVANIGAAALTELAPVVSARVAPGGWLGLSGLSPAQVSLVASAYRGLDVEAVRRDEDWAAVVLRRPASAPPTGGG
jgi:ribosomal protein L11 methyltransferase